MDSVSRSSQVLRVQPFFGLYAEIRRRDRIDPDERTDVPAIAESARVTFGAGVGPQATLTARSASARAIDFYQSVQDLGAAP